MVFRLSLCITVCLTILWTLYFYNFSATLTDWIKSNEIFEMPFKFFVGKCKKTLTNKVDNFSKIWTNMWKQLEIKIKIFKNILTKGQYGPDVFLCKYGMSAKFLVWFFCFREDENNLKSIFDCYGGQNQQY